LPEGLGSGTFEQNQSTTTGGDWADRVQELAGNSQDSINTATVTLSDNTNQINTLVYLDTTFGTFMFVAFGTKGPTPLPCLACTPTTVRYGYPERSLPGGRCPGSDNIAATMLRDVLSRLAHDGVEPRRDTLEITRPGSDKLKTSTDSFSTGGDNARTRHHGPACRRRVEAKCRATPRGGLAHLTVRVPGLRQ